MLAWGQMVLVSASVKVMVEPSESLYGSQLLERVSEIDHLLCNKL